MAAEVGRPTGFDGQICKRPNEDEVEQTINKLKSYRAAGVRYDKPAYV
ncbi:hypothetical protein [Streptomyces sp. NPDC054975]